MGSELGGEVVAALRVGVVVLTEWIDSASTLGENTVLGSRGERSQWKRLFHGTELRLRLWMLMRLGWIVSVLWLKWLGWSRRVLRLRLRLGRWKLF